MVSNPVPSTKNSHLEVASLEDKAIAAIQQGRKSEAQSIWRRIVALQPGHVRALTQLGQFSFVNGEYESAQQYFLRVTELDGSEPRQWVNLALAAQKLGQDVAEEAALFKALTIDPYDLLALVMRGGLFERQGRVQAAAKAYGAAATVSPSLDRLPPDLRKAVEYAMQFRDQQQQKLGEFIDRYLEPHLKKHSKPDVARFQNSVDLLIGRKIRFNSQPMQYFIPDLLPIEFFDRKQFPWLDEIESGTATIREEFLALMASDHPGFVPYIRYANDQPVAQWKELNESLNWTAFHLMKDGVPVKDNADRCPKTMEIMRAAPSPDQPGRTPVTLFSLLKPKTRIPPHVGASNARLLTHLPLIVPPGCGFRVGNTTREWIPGQAWVFDDTIEHEAWNNSESLRVVLIFDIWHPNLTTEERDLITVLSSALNVFSTDPESGYGG